MSIYESIYSLQLASAYIVEVKLKNNKYYIYEYYTYLDWKSNHYHTRRIYSFKLIHTQSQFILSQLQLLNTIN